MASQHYSSVPTAPEDTDSPEWIKDISIRKPGYLSAQYIITYVLLFSAISVTALAAVVLLFTIREVQGTLGSYATLIFVSSTCDTGLQTYNIIVHLFINLYGTIVLGASNYLQQTCASQNFREIETQMKIEGDVSFGSNSIYSIFKPWRSWTLKLLWLSLVITSLPIHLFLNGVVGYAAKTTYVSSNDIDLYDPGSNITLVLTLLEGSELDFCYSESMCLVHSGGRSLCDRLQKHDSHSQYGAS